jgi:hypothetical protein
MSERIRAGTEVFFEVEVRDNNTSPPPLVNPGSGVKITIYYPSGAEAQAETAMTNVGTGVYTSAYQTITTQALGSYLAAFKAQDGTSITLTPKWQVFDLVA